MAQEPPASGQIREELLSHFNAQTGKLVWPELARYFARGVVVIVEAELDLVEVAAAMTQDRVFDIESWSSAGQIRRANDDDARIWHERNCQFWSVVVAPWVLVQEIKLQNS